MRPYWILYSLPIAAMVGSTFGGAWIWLPAALVFLLIPCFDWILQRVSPANLTKVPQRPQSAPKKEIDWLLYLFLPTLAAVIAFQGAKFVSELNQTNPNSWILIGLVVATSLCSGGLGITLAHELVHRQGIRDQWVGRLLLSLVAYGHFSIEHVYGHHKHVATPQDPVTARAGENFYSFFLRAIPGVFFSGWSIERERLNKKGRPAFDRENRILQTLLVTAALMIVFTVWLGWAGLLFFVLQSLGAIILLEVIDYVEHYGLRRKELQPGVYEPVRAWHSWDSTAQVSNWFLINLQHHADHHLHALRPYHELSTHAHSPKMPLGYPLMALMALVPPLWFWVMNPRLQIAQPSA